MAWHYGDRDQQTRLDRLWDRVTGQDKLKNQIENLQDRSEITAYEMRDLNYLIMDRDNQIKNLQEENMAFRDSIDQAAREIGQRMGQEANAARETLAQSFDLRLRTMEVLGPRDTNQGGIMRHDITQPPAPKVPEPDIDR